MAENDVIGSVDISSHAADIAVPEKFHSFRDDTEEESNGDVAYSVAEPLNGLAVT